MSESKYKDFNHLKIHTQYSICEGAIKIDDLKEKSKDLKYVILLIYVGRSSFLKKYLKSEPNQLSELKLILNLKKQ